jgi:glycogen debranching enzyme
VIAPDGTRDPSVRPNQLFAASLPYPLLTREQAARMLEEVTRELLTPCGLRTLARGDPAYRGRCEGGPEQRDHAYHQGTVWPWLLGAYVDAELYAHDESEPARARMRDALSALAGRLGQPCAGQLAEIFDADAPHAPRGCVAQAWSVAEPLRAWRRVSPDTDGTNMGANR